ncbi:MAG: hypothetical protein HY718_10085 [Planctomycetes bacterium]|nr:hypothetical protein [Planctomycetota bacterium]
MNTPEPDRQPQLRPGPTGNVRPMRPNPLVTLLLSAAGFALTAGAKCDLPGWEKPATLPEEVVRLLGGEESTTLGVPATPETLWGDPVPFPDWESVSDSTGW